MSSSARCGVCFEDHPLERFRVISCGHTFCANCTASLSDTNHRCPTCRTSMAGCFADGRKSAQFYLTLSDAGGANSVPTKPSTSRQAKAATSTRTVFPEMIDGTTIKDIMGNIQLLVESLLGHDGVNPDEAGILDTINVQTATIIVDLRRLVGSNSKAQTDFEHLTNAIVDLLQTLNCLTQHASQLNEMLQIAQVERGSFSNSLRALQAETRELLTRVSNTEGERDAVHDAYARLLGENHELQEQVVDLQETREVAVILGNHLRERDIELSTQMGVLQRKIEELERAAEISTTTENGLRESNAELRRQVATLQQQVDGVEATTNSTRDRDETRNLLDRIASLEADGAMYRDRLSNGTTSDITSPTPILPPRSDTPPPRYTSPPIPSASPAPHTSPIPPVSTPMPAASPPIPPTSSLVTHVPPPVPPPPRRQVSSRRPPPPPPPRRQAPPRAPTPSPRPCSMASPASNTGLPSPPQTPAQHLEQVVQAEATSLQSENPFA